MAAPGFEHGQLGSLVVFRKQDAERIASLVFPPEKSPIFLSPASGRNHRFWFYGGWVSALESQPDSNAACLSHGLGQRASSLSIPCVQSCSDHTRFFICPPLPGHFPALGQPWGRGRMSLLSSPHGTGTHTVNYLCQSAGKLGKQRDHERKGHCPVFVCAHGCVLGGAVVLEDFLEERAFEWM